MRAGLPSLLRYGLVGVGANILLYLGYLALTHVAIGHKIAMTLMFLTGVAITFVLNRGWSFQVQHPAPGALMRYCITYAAGYVVNLAGLMLLVDGLGFRHDVVQAVLIVAVAALMFVLQRQWVFREEHRNVPPGAAT